MNKSSNWQFYFRYLLNTKKLITVLLFFVFIQFSFAQKVEFGLETGLTVGVLIGKVDWETSSGQANFGPYIGSYIDTELSDKLDLRLSLLYNKTGVKYQQNTPRTDTLYALVVPLGTTDTTFYTPTHYTADIDGTYKLHYLELPISLNWKLSDKFALRFGPRFSYLLKGENKGSAIIDLGSKAGLQDDFETEEAYLNALFTQDIDNFDDSEALHRFDFGFLIGTHWNIIPAVSIDFSLNGGIVSVQEKSTLIEEKFYNIFIRSGLSLNLSELF